MSNEPARVARPAHPARRGAVRDDDGVITTPLLSNEPTRVGTTSLRSSENSTRGMTACDVVMLNPHEPARVGSSSTSNIRENGTRGVATHDHAIYGAIVLPSGESAHVIHTYRRHKNGTRCGAVRDGAAIQHSNESTRAGKTTINASVGSGNDARRGAVRDGATLLLSNEPARINKIATTHHSNSGVHMEAGDGSVLHGPEQAGVIIRILFVLVAAGDIEAYGVAIAVEMTGEEFVTCAAHPDGCPLGGIVWVFDEVDVLRKLEKFLIK